MNILKNIMKGPQKLTDNKTVICYLGSALFSWSLPMNVLVRHWDRGGVGLLPNL